MSENVNNEVECNQGKNLVLGILHSSDAHTEYPVLTDSQWNISNERTVENQTRKILDLYHYSMLTRNRARERFQSYSEDTQSQLNHGGGEATGFLSSGSSVLMNEMLDLEDGDVLDTSNEVAIVTTFILDVSTSLEFDNLLNKRIEQLNINGLDEAFDAIKKIWKIFCQRSELTWNDICTFLYCSYRIVCKSLPLGLSIRSIINFTTDWLLKEALDWIVSCGGWSTLFVSPLAIWISIRMRNWSQYFPYFGMACLAVLPVLFVIYKRRK